MERAGLLILVSLVVLLLAGGCTAPQPQGTVTPTVTGTVTESRCGFTSCHGMDLSCGTNPPEACTAIYMAGDKCRQYAYCTSAGGSCMLVKTSNFDTCRACVDRCTGADDSEILLCEEKC